jgi:hypothetical protein
VPEPWQEKTRYLGRRDGDTREFPDFEQARSYTKSGVRIVLGDTSTSREAALQDPSVLHTRLQESPERTLEEIGRNIPRSGPNWQWERALNKEAEKWLWDDDTVGRRLVKSVAKEFVEDALQTAAEGEARDVERVVDLLRTSVAHDRLRSYVLSRVLVERQLIPRTELDGLDASLRDSGVLAHEWRAKDYSALKYLSGSELDYAIRRNTEVEYVEFRHERIEQLRDASSLSDRDLKPLGELLRTLPDRLLDERYSEHVASIALKMAGLAGRPGDEASTAEGLLRSLASRTEFRKLRLSDRTTVLKVLINAVAGDNALKKQVLMVLPKAAAPVKDHRHEDQVDQVIEMLARVDPSLIREVDEHPDLVIEISLRRAAVALQAVPQIPAESGRPQKEFLRLLQSPIVKDAIAAKVEEATELLESELEAKEEELKQTRAQVREAQTLVDRAKEKARRDQADVTGAQLRVAKAEERRDIASALLNFLISTGSAERVLGPFQFELPGDEVDFDPERHEPLEGLSHDALGNRVRVREGTIAAGAEVVKRGTVVPVRSPNTP